MRHVIIAASLAVVVTAFVTACGQAPRAFTGKAERGTSAILAVDAAGQNYRAAPAADGAFDVDVVSDSELQFFVLQSDGLVQTIEFPGVKGALTSTLPPSTGLVSLGSITTDTQDIRFARAAGNPIAQIPNASTSSGNGGGGDKTTICHSTGSSHNPFVEITVSNNALPAHSKHHDGRDIIPAPASGCPAGDGGPSGPGDNGHGNGHGHNGGDGGDDTGGSTGGDTGGSTGGDTGGSTSGGSTGGSSGSPEIPPQG